MTKIVPHTTSGKATTTRQRPPKAVYARGSQSDVLLQAEQTILGLLLIRQPDFCQPAGQARWVMSLTKSYSSRCLSERKCHVCQEPKRRHVAEHVSIA